MKYKLREKLGELHKKLEGVARDTMSIFKRKQAKKWYLRYYIDGVAKQISLQTKDEQIANRILTELKSKIEYGDTELGAVIQMNIAKLTREQRNRTWNDVHEVIVGCELKRPTTIATYQSSWNNDVFLGLKDQTLVETTHDQILTIFNESNYQCQKHLFMLYNYAKKHGWLVSPNLVPKADWEDGFKQVGDSTASIADGDHFRLVALVQDDLENWQSKINTACCKQPSFTKDVVMPNGNGKTSKAIKYKRNQFKHGKDYYRLMKRDKEVMHEFYWFIQLMWELGASNADVRELTTENLDWDTRDDDGNLVGHVIFKRKKWKGVGKHSKRERMPIYFPMSPDLKEILRPLYARAKKLPEGKQYLLPRLSKMQSCNVTRIFHTYLKAAGVKLEKKCRDGRIRKLILHSYRYRMAERLYEMGYTEREAQMLLGHNSKAIHQAYAKHNAMRVKSMDKMQKKIDKDKVIKINRQLKAA